MKEDITYVGLDVHKNSIQVAMLMTETGELVEWKETVNGRGYARLIKRLKKKARGELMVCYEAGPCGYTLQRQLNKAQVACRVIAPSLIPIKPGQRIKTNRRDARNLVLYLSKGDLLQEVVPPTPEQEALRELSRCRAAKKEDVSRARHQLSKFLLRNGLAYRSGRSWTKGHWRWLKGVDLEERLLQQVFEHYLVGVEREEEELKAVEQELRYWAEQEPYREAVGWLRCFRGFDTISAVVVVSELYSFGRFQTAKGLMNFLGLTPSENSSGDELKRGRITKAGNGRVRSILVEAAWHYRHRPAVGAGLRQRRKGQPAPVIGIADKAMRRLYRRYHRLVMRGKDTRKIVVAIARELVGFLWDVLSRPYRQQQGMAV